MPLSRWECFSQRRRSSKSPCLLCEMVVAHGLFASAIALRSTANSRHFRPDPQQDVFESIESSDAFRVLHLR